MTQTIVTTRDVSHTKCYSDAEQTFTACVPALNVKLPTSNCKPWCDHHLVETAEARFYDGVPHVWHYSETVEVPHERGTLGSVTAPLEVSLLLYEPANTDCTDPLYLTPHVQVDAGDRIFDLTPKDARAFADALLRACSKLYASQASS